MDLMVWVTWVVSWRCTKGIGPWLLDMLIPALGLGERDGLVLVRKACTEELWCQAVVLYETTPGGHGAQ